MRVRARPFRAGRRPGADLRAAGLSQSHIEDGAEGEGGDAGPAGSGVVASIAGTGAVTAGGCGGIGGTGPAAPGTAGDTGAGDDPAARIIENPRNARIRPTITSPHIRK